MHIRFSVCVCIFSLFSSVCTLSFSGELHGRVVDRGTLLPDGAAKGVPGVDIAVYDGIHLIATASVNAKGIYRIKNINVARCRVTYRAKGFTPTIQSRDYNVADTTSRDVYLDANRSEVLITDGKRSKKGTKGGYYHGVARGILALSHLPSYFAQDDEDSLVDLGSFFDNRDSSQDYQGVFCELLWAEFLSQDRPLETRYYLAAALAPLLDSIGWSRPKGMARYLDVSPEAVQKVAQALHEAFRNPKKLPNPQDVKQMGLSVALASQMANEYLADSELSEGAKDRFLGQWKKSWGKDAPSFKEDGEETSFQPNVLMSKLSVSKPDNQEVQYLRGRGLFAERNYLAAIEVFSNANRLANGHSASRFMEAQSYLRLGRDQEAKGRFQALLESPENYWKCQGYRGVARIAERSEKHSEAASNLWKAQRLIPSAENIALLAEASLKLSDRAEIEKLLESQASRYGDHRAHYWLGRYAEENQQGGVAEDHYRKAWTMAPVAEYAEALSQIYISRDEFSAAMTLLEAVRSRLTPEGRVAYAECLLQAGRAQDAVKEFGVAYAAHPTPELLLRYVDALILNNRPQEAMRIANAISPQTEPPAKAALAKAFIANHDAMRARPIVESLLKGDASNAEYHFLMGATWFEMNNYEKAKSQFDDAIRFRQDYPEANFYCGLAFAKLGEGDAARSLFNDLTQRTSAEWKAKGLMGMGLSFSAQKKPEAAESYYQRSLQVVESAEVEALLALSRRRLGGSDMWVALAKKAYDLDPNHPKAILAQGEAMITQGKKAQALLLFNKALETNPNSCDLLSGMAKAQFLTGDYKAGKTNSLSAIVVCPQDAAVYYYAGMNADKLHNYKEAEGFFKSYRKAGGDESILPKEFR